MRKLHQIIGVFFLAGVFASCNSTYHYHLPMPETSIYHEKGEIHASGQLGISGLAVGGGYALSDNFALGGRFQSTAWLARGYMMEIDANYYHNGWFMASAGLGYGHVRRFTDSTQNEISLRGDLYRPYVQVLLQTRERIFFRQLHARQTIGLKTSYIWYDGASGFPSVNRFTDGRFVFEPVISATQGLDLVQLEFALSVPLYDGVFKDFSAPDRAYPFPLNVSAGLQIRIFNP